jgi:hypothetical protein
VRFTRCRAHEVTSRLQVQALREFVAYVRASGELHQDQGDEAECAAGG